MDYDLIRSDRKTFAAQIKGNRLIIRVPKRAKDSEIERFILQNKNWIDTHMAKAQAREKALETCGRLTQDEIEELYEKAARVIPERVAYYAQAVGVTYGKITIRMQKSRWGSCSAEGNLNFNCLLMLAPPEVLDSVVVHELCHRKEMNHSERFYAEVLRVMPDYHTRRKWLKEHGTLLLSMAERRAGSARSQPGKRPEANCCRLQGESPCTDGK